MTFDTPAARVMAVVQAGRKLVGVDGAPGKEQGEQQGEQLGEQLRQRLVRFSGLSKEGVDLALQQHLELRPSDADLEALLRWATPVRTCHVVLASNVCTAALRAMACAVACAPQVRVRPSRRDPVLAELLVKELESSIDIAITDEVVPKAGDALHLYGSDDSIAAICDRLEVGVSVSKFGSGMGIALVDRDASADALARDMVVYDGQGCLSPRFAFVAGGDAAPFAARLDEALCKAAERVPRGPVGDASAAALTRYRTTMQSVGVVFEGTDHLVALDQDPRALLLPPALRAILIVPAADASALIEPWSPYVTTIGHSLTAFGHGSTGQPAAESTILTAMRRACPEARITPLGRMQQPPLDGPVDRRWID